MTRWTISQGGLACVLAVALLAALPAVAVAAVRSSAPPTPAGRSAPVGPAIVLAAAAAPSRGPAPDSHVARYRVDNYSLTLDTSGPLPLLRFSNSTEIFALRARRGPRGDTIYVNDAGDTMLRATGLGGLTAFTPDRPQGIPADYVGAAPSLGLPDVRSGVDLGKRLFQASAQISKDSGHGVKVIAGNAPDLGVLSGDDLSGPQVFPLVWDTATVVVQAFDEAVSGSNAKRKSVIADVTLVHIIEGRPPSARVDKDTLTLVITPEMGLAGRPSSFLIFRALFK